MLASVVRGVATVDYLVVGVIGHDARAEHWLSVDTGSGRKGDSETLGDIGGPVLYVRGCSALMVMIAISRLSPLDGRTYAGLDRTCTQEKLFCEERHGQ